MDPNAEYANGLKAQGVPISVIRDNLLRRGVSQNDIERLAPLTPVPTGAGTNAQPSAPGAPQQHATEFIGSRNKEVDAYTDYIKSLLSRGMSWQAIQQDLVARGLDQAAIDGLLKIASQAVPSASYPPQSPVPVDRAPIGQAPITIESDGMEAQPKIGSLRGWLIVLACCLLPTIVILFDQPGRFANSTETLLTLGDAAATIGLCLYAINMVLATRISKIEDYFGGLNRVYIAHAIIGGSALTAVLLHVTLLSLRMVPLGMHEFASFYVPTTKYMATAYGQFALIGLFGLLAITFFAKLPYRLWLATHKYLGVAFLLVGLHVLYEPNEITNNVFIKLYLIALILVGLAAYIYRTLLPNLFVRRYLYQVQSALEKTKGIVEVSLKPVDKAIQFEAGQFIFISFLSDGLSPEWHPFTVVSAPSIGSLSIDIKSLGGYTETLTRILPNMVGMTAMIEGAYGRFAFRNFRNAKQVWIAGGIGVTPFLSMAQSLGGGDYDIDLYYSVKSEAELIDLDKLAGEQMNQPGKTFRVIPFVTDKYNRRLTADLIAATTHELLERDILICGPPAMMEGLKKQFIDMGVKKYRVHTEEFSIT